MTTKSKETPPAYAVLECPECGEQYIISAPTDSPSETAILFSDGFYIENDDMHWRTPLIIGCITCELGFRPEKGKQVATGTFDELLEKFPGIKKAIPPAAGTLVLDLRARMKMEASEEVAIRREFWYAAQHTDKGRALLQRNKKFGVFYIQNLSKLIEIISTKNEAELLIKAELLRQSEKYNEAILMLQNITSEKARQIEERANAKDSDVFQCK
ncbi:MAG TPA: hypothetical protein VJ909_01125 [Prolixibacteraceae bacterium]|nr:hypothetical protein [Prolixibacteraceae bacterium]